MKITERHFFAVDEILIQNHPSSLEKQVINIITNNDFSWPAQEAKDKLRSVTSVNILLIREFLVFESPHSGFLFSTS